MGQIKFRQLTNKCLDNATLPADSANAYVTIKTCGTAASQQWTSLKYANGFMLQNGAPSISGRPCLFSNWPEARLTSCRNQLLYWKQRPDGSIESTVRTGVCLGIPRLDATDGTAVLMQPCDGSAGQRFTSF